MVFFDLVPVRYAAELCEETVSDVRAVHLFGYVFVWDRAQLNHLIVPDMPEGDEVGTAFFESGVVPRQIARRIAGDHRFPGGVAEDFMQRGEHIRRQGPVLEEGRADL